MAEKETQTKKLQNAVGWANGGLISFSIGGAGVALTELIAQPKDNPEFAIYIVGKFISYTAMIGGATVGLRALIELADFARSHIHPHAHNLTQVSAHQHQVPSHQHKQDDLITPKPPTAKDKSWDAAKQFLQENDSKLKYEHDLEELGLSRRAINPLLRSYRPHNEMPLSVAGLRFFLKYNIPLRSSGLGAKTISEIKEKVAPITYPESIEDYQKLTQSEKAQMAENGFIRNV